MLLLSIWHLVPCLHTEARTCCCCCLYILFILGITFAVMQERVPRGQCWTHLGPTVMVKTSINHQHYSSNFQGPERPLTKDLGYLMLGTDRFLTPPCPQDKISFSYILTLKKMSNDHYFLMYLFFRCKIINWKRRNFYFKDVIPNSVK